MRVSQVLAVLICVATGFVGADWGAILSNGGGVVEAQASGEALGYPIGLAAVPLVLSTLFLVWSGRTRRYIPFVALGLAFVSTAGRVSTNREEVDRELSRTRGLMSALADSAGRGVGDRSSSAPPSSPDAKLLWATNRALAEAPAHLREVADQHGVDPDNLPAAWGTSRYMANATSHPEVERYWQGYRDYLAVFQEGFPGWLQSRVAAHAREAGVPSGTLRGYLEGMSRGAESAQLEPLTWADSTASAALAYHRFLVSVDARVSYDAAQDMAMFGRDADLERANELQARVQRAAERLNRARQASARRNMERVDSLALQLQ
jgi:hypothetical protein